ncbi:MAG: dephospho-CoA kinase [Xanthomonadales bacterium]|nr:dephospho-CoA kinase [Xanthomonadales bacterium]
MNSQATAPIVILTGGVASGKSAAADSFTRRGIAVIDTDQLARDVVMPGSQGLHGLVAMTGQHILHSDGRLDRRQLREMIIADPSLRERVEQLLHPLIEQAAIAAIEQTQGPYCILAVPLFVESGRFQWASRVLVVDVPESVQLTRLMARDDTSEAQARGLMAAQASRAQRLAVADDVIDNQGTLAQLDAQVEVLHQQYLKHFQPSP